jgi:hypothetical protein
MSFYSSNANIERKNWSELNDADFDGKDLLRGVAVVVDENKSLPPIITSYRMN